MNNAEHNRNIWKNKKIGKAFDFFIIKPVKICSRNNIFIPLP